MSCDFLALAHARPHSSQLLFALSPSVTLTCVLAEAGYSSPSSSSVSHSASLDFLFGFLTFTNWLRSASYGCLHGATFSPILGGFCAICGLCKIRTFPGRSGDFLKNAAAAIW